MKLRYRGNAIGNLLIIAFGTIALLPAPSMSQNPSEPPGVSGGPRSAGGGTPGVPGVLEPGGAPGSAGGSSPGSEGMPDREDAYLKMLKDSKQHGVRSQNYIGSLLGLGMYYNRAGRHADAERVMLQALATVDSGALKPSSKPRFPQIMVEEHHEGGVVSATNVTPPAPYEEMMEQLLPALVDAETATKHYAAAEVHIKRLIAMAENNRIMRVPNLMFAYSQYANLLRKQQRVKEAKIYQQKADAINSTIKGL